MTLVKVHDSRLCGHVQPVARDGSGMTVDEYRCVLLKGHPGFHTDGAGRAWANVEDLMNRLEREGKVKRKIISLPAKK